MGEIRSVKEYLYRAIPDYMKCDDDVRVFIELMGLTFDELKGYVINFSDVVDPDKVPRDLMEALGQGVGYKYLFNLSEEENRLVLKYFFERLYRRRGTIESIKNAILYTGNPELATLSHASKFDAEVNEYYGLIEIIDWTGRITRKEWLHAVFPAGIGLYLSVGSVYEDSVAGNQEEILIHDIEYRRIEDVKEVEETPFMEIEMDIVPVNTQAFKADLIEVDDFSTTLYWYGMKEGHVRAAREEISEMSLEP